MAASKNESVTEQLDNVLDGLDTVSDDFDQTKRDVDNGYEVVKPARRKVDNQADRFLMKSYLSKLV